MLKYRLYLLITALLWGSTFVFQRLSTDTMGAFSFGSLRFTLGVIAISPLVYRQWKQEKANPKPVDSSRPSLILCSLAIGTALFAGTTLQQLGLFYTTAGKSGFITALYIVIVPLLSLFFYQPLRISHVLGIIISVVGLYLFAFHGDGSPLNFGDALTLISALCWSLQIILIDRFVKYHSGIFLAVGQFIVCSILSYIAIPIAGESLNWQIIEATAIPILYAGIMSSGVAFTLQIIGQTRVPPTEGSMIMSLEMIFSGIFGYLCLGEIMSTRELWGASLMTIGIFLAQIPGQIIWVRKRLSKS